MTNSWLGTCEPEEFSKVLSKLGVVIPKPDLDIIFKHYDKDSKGSIDYKEFASLITGGSAPSQ